MLHFAQHDNHESSNKNKGIVILSPPRRAKNLQIADLGHILDPSTSLGMSLSGDNDFFNSLLKFHGWIPANHLL
jgi:hypothetical protein